MSWVAVTPVVPATRDLERMVAPGNYLFTTFRADVVARALGSLLGNEGLATRIRDPGPHGGHRLTPTRASTAERTEPLRISALGQSGRSTPRCFYSDSRPAAVLASSSALARLSWFRTKARRGIRASRSATSVAGDGMSGVSRKMSG